MHNEVLAIFRKDLEEALRTIERLLPVLNTDSDARNELARVFHSIKGSASLLKLDGIKRASAFFEKCMEQDISDQVIQGITEYKTLLASHFLENEPLFYELEKKCRGKGLKEIMGPFKEMLARCSENFDDYEAIAALEELSAEIKETGTTPLIHEAGKALNLCFFAVGKKLLVWTRSHFDLITQVAEYLSKDPKDSSATIETCVSIISAVANDALQFMQKDLGVHLDEGGRRFLSLFLSEIKTQIHGLENDLLLLEKEPGDRKIASKFMRAAHSIKGAAKTVELESIVRLAHFMEEIFSFVQKGGRVSPDGIESLFQAIDLLNSLAQVDSVQVNFWLANNKENLELVSKRLKRNVYKKEGSSSPISSNKEIKLLKSQSPRFLRIDLSHINHLMGIAGEFLVETKSLEAFESNLNKAKMRASLFDSALKTVDDPSVEAIRSLAKEQVQGLAGLIAEFDRFARTSETLSTKFYQEMVESRMRPFSEGTEFLPRLIRDLCKQLGKKAELEIHGKDTLVDREILEKLETPLAHLVRNAVAHGIELPRERVKAGKNEIGTIKLGASHRSGSLVISVSDDGLGIDLPAIKKIILEKKLSHESEMSECEMLSFLFHPGFTTARSVTDVSGRGIGLNIVSSVVEQLGGKVTVSKDAAFTMTLPFTLSIIRALIVNMGGEPYAFPLARIKKVFCLAREDILHREGREYFYDGETNIGLISGAHILGVPPIPTADLIPVVVINDYGIVVDSFLGEREIAVHELDKKLGKIEMVMGGSFMEDGSPLLILDVEGIKRYMEASGVR